MMMVLVGHNPLFSYGYDFGIALAVFHALRGYGTEAIQPPPPHPSPSVQIGPVLSALKLQAWETTGSKQPAKLPQQSWNTKEYFAIARTQATTQYNNKNTLLISLVFVSLFHVKQQVKQVHIVTSDTARYCKSGMDTVSGPQPLAI